MSSDLQNNPALREGFPGKAMRWYRLKANQRLISWAMRLLLLAASGWYLYAHVLRSGRFEDLVQLSASILRNPYAFGLLTICVALVFVNWGLEAFKWQFLIRKMENISFLTSFRAILSGTTVSLFTPNRVGEYVGRVLFLDPDVRVRAIFATFVGSIAQLVVTLIMGAIGFIYYEKAFQFPIYVSVAVAAGGVVFIAFSLFFYFNIRALRAMIPAKKWAKPLRKYLKVYRLYSRRQLERIFAISLMRYFVFSVQFFLLLVFFGVHIPFFQAMMLIFLMYLMQTVYPTAGITELMVRGATTTFIFAAYTPDPAPVLAASYGIWLINLLLPACMGGLVFGFAGIRKRLRAA